FVVFGVLSALWTVYIVYVSLIIWNGRVVDSLRAILSSGGDLGALALNGLLILLALSFLALIAFELFQAARGLFARVRRAGLMDGPERVAMGLLLLAAAVVFGLWLAGPLVAAPAALAPGVLALLAAIYLASRKIGRSFGGAPAGVWMSLA